MGNPIKLVLGTPDKPVRLSYAHIWEPTKLPKETDDKLKYQVTALIPKSDTKLIEAIKEAFAQAKEAGKAEKWGGKIPANIDHILRDGDVPKEEGGEVPEEYRDHWYIVAKDKKQPGIVSRSGQPILTPSQVYSGCYALVSVTLYAYNVDASKGVAASLNHVMFIADGEKLSGKADAQTDFADYISNDDDATQKKKSSALD